MIRRATDADIPRLVEMGRRFLKESPYHRHIAENPQQMAELGRQLMKNAGGLLISEHDGQITGMFGFVVYDHFMSGERVAGEVFWWVEPEARGDGVKLLRTAEQEARNAGAKAMQMIAPDEHVAGFYARLGYIPVEMTYQRSL